MTLNAYAILDSKVGAYSRPYFARSHGEALRALMNTVSDPNTDLHKWPEDYTLCHIGYYNEDTGRLESGVAPEPIAKALDFHPKTEGKNAKN